MKKPLPSQARLRELLDYDPLTGGLVWKSHQRRTDYIGKPAGNTTPGGRRSICIDFEHYQGHRLIWMWMTGEDPAEKEVDHIDRNPLNNRWTNLRLATHSQNMTNCKGKSRSGLPKGVQKQKLSDRFMSRIRKDGKVHYLGTYDTPEEAHQAYCVAAADLHGEFAAV